MGLKNKLGLGGQRREDTAQTTGSDVLPHDVERELRAFKKQHKWDPFLDIDKLDTVDNALASGDVEKEAAVEESLLVEDSPYPEVRSSVCFPPRFPLHNKL